MYEIEYANSFKKNYKLVCKRGYEVELLFKVIEQLATNGNVDLSYKPHKLSGKYVECWECHIRPDWLLIWQTDEENKIIRLLYTGTHSDLFR